MKPIRIHASNITKIETILFAANRAATAHTFTTYQEVLRQASEAEGWLERLGISKKTRAGAGYSVTSGGRVAKSYRNSRIATFLWLDRRATGWFLTTAVQTAIDQEPPRARLLITREQEREAQSRLAEQYSVRQGVTW